MVPMHQDVVFVAAIDSLHTFDRGRAGAPGCLVRRVSRRRS